MRRTKSAIGRRSLGREVMGGQKSEVGGQRSVGGGWIGEGVFYLEMIGFVQARKVIRLDGLKPILRFDATL